MATSDKYDRQIRLWGAHGQRALGTSRVCVLGSGAVVTETLKNLVLPGIGHFALVDDALVQQADLGSNFFVTPSALGQSRAKEVVKNLLELNPNVTGHAYIRSPVEAATEEYIRSFDIVVAAGIPLASAVSLCNICEDAKKPMVFIRTAGFTGSVRLFTNEHTVVETKDDGTFTDLRLTDPFAELAEFAASFDLEKMNDAQHSHVPYVVLLMQAIQIYRSRNEGRVPTTNSEDRGKLKAILDEMRRSDSEENFREANEHIMHAVRPYKIPEEVTEILQEASSKSFRLADAQPFWLIAAAIARFQKACGKLPLSGVLPDMKSDTETFVQMQNIYEQRALGDVAAVSASVASIVGELGGGADCPQISSEQISTFCKNAHTCRLFRLRKMEEECTPSSANVDEIRSELSDSESLIGWYLALWAAEIWRDKHGGEWPGTWGRARGACEQCRTSSGLEEVTERGPQSCDICMVDSHFAEVKACADELLKSLGLEEFSVSDDILHEITRSGGSELHTTAAIIGGVAAQEVVKLITHQFTPLNNTFLWDGVNSRGQSLCL